MSLKRRCLGVALVFAGSVGLSTAACGSASEDPNAVTPYGGAGGAGGVGAGGGGGAGGINIGAESGAGGGGGGLQCGGNRYQAQKAQLDIYVMFDDSGSMVPWWLQVTQAFADF